jgi:hypothetical protein
MSRIGHNKSLSDRSETSAPMQKPFLTQRIPCWAAGLALVLGASTAAAAPARNWMTEEAMRAAFIGRTLDGHYVDGLAWTETYAKDGKLDYRESIRSGRGTWHFQGSVFCTFYEPGYGLNGGCWTTVQVSANCYEFYPALWRDPEGGEDTAPGPLRAWIARAWHQGEASSCEEPSA